jgi:quinolinate synthase
MAESADILTGPHQQVILPDLNAGCSMADMANLDDVEQIWDELAEVTDVEAIVPITYVNSAAALKAFVGRNSGAVCTSSNARAVLTWALDLDAPGGGGTLAGASGPWAESPGSGRRANKVLFFPDQHLGRNTGFQLGFGASDMQVIDPRRRLGGLADADVKEATFLLWKGHCSVHQRFRTEHVEAFRSEHPGGIVIVHPECSHEVVEIADQVGSTDYIIRAVSGSPAGSIIAVGTEIHLVDRLARENPDRTVLSLDPLVCPCSTMFRIDLPHLAWVLDGLVAGEVRNRIAVDEATAADARVALERMLAIA